MKVSLLSHTPDIENLIACAAKLCYSSSTIEELKQSLDYERAVAFIEKLISMGHESPLEHCSFTFGVEGVSRSLTHQLVRHRIASYSQKSQRYVSENQFEYVAPETICKNAVISKKYKAFMKKCSDTYKEFVDLGVPKEDARYILPNACTSQIIVTMNVRSLLNFFKHRCCNRAQWEIRELANAMLQICKQIAPTIFNNAGASCVRGKCPEGQMGCNKNNIKKDTQIKGQMSFEDMDKSSQ